MPREGGGLPFAGRNGGRWARLSGETFVSGKEAEMRTNEKVGVLERERRRRAELRERGEPDPVAESAKRRLAGLYPPRKENP